MRRLLGEAPDDAGVPQQSAFFVPAGRAPEPDWRLDGVRLRQAGRHRPSAAAGTVDEQVSVSIMAWVRVHFWFDCWSEFLFALALRFS
jgi:hypothetical protein